MVDVTNRSDLLQAAISYRVEGLCALPAIRGEKRPAIGSWKEYQARLPTDQETTAWFTDETDAICLITGAVSGNLELIDFDHGGELFAAWSEAIAPDLFAKLVIETSQSGGKHVVYRCESAVGGNTKLAQRQTNGEVQTLIETRGEGGLFLCAPTDGYRLLRGDLALPARLSEEERESLLQEARQLNEFWPQAAQDGDVGERSPNGECLRPGDDYSARGELGVLLRSHGWRSAGVRTDGNQHWTRPGKKHGTSATLKDGVFYVFSSSAHPLQPGQAYSPFAVYALLEHGGDFDNAARALSAEGFGETNVRVEVKTDVDLSGMLDHDKRAPKPEDPGTIPEQLFEVPGLIRQVMDFTLAKAPYPNVALAFCGAMALQSYLCGRKVRTACDLRPNIYLLALASSGSGKDFPRKVNSRVLFETCQLNSLGDKFASGEGIQDALLRSPAMLFQNDEMDGLLRQINLDKENRRESIPNILLTLYTSSNDLYPIRAKAGQKESLHVDQPHLTLLGTATPRYFYESLSQRMLTGGLFARFMIVDIGKRGEGQKPGSVRDLPDAIIDVARWWSELVIGRGDLFALHPEPIVVPATEDADEAIESLQSEADLRYQEADNANDEVARSAWSRTCENAKKLALMYACSENHEEPVISRQGVEWAQAFALHQTQRQLYLAAEYVAENPFHAECLKFMQRLSKAPDGRLKRRDLMRVMRCKANEFDQIVETLIEQDEIEKVTVRGTARALEAYRAL